jgi:hypothetical protein
MVVAFTTLQKNKNYIVPGEPIYKKKVLSGKWNTQIVYPVSMFHFVNKYDLFFTQVTPALCE